MENPRTLKNESFTKVSMHQGPAQNDRWGQPRLATVENPPLGRFESGQHNDPQGYARLAKSFGHHVAPFERQRSKRDIGGALARVFALSAAFCAFAVDKHRQIWRTLPTALLPSLPMDRED